MARTLLLLTVCWVASMTVFAQNSIQFQIEHKLGVEAFAFQMGVKNNINHDFNVTRLEYYISEISLLHDGGQETTIEDVWLLIDASESTAVDLGEYAIDEVEAVRFHIGVNEEYNHLDPASYPADHPLAPQFPSMHWGWASGYRFVAIEGFGSASYNQLFEVHALGDNNYLQTQVDLTATTDNGLMTIALEADYTRALENIAVNSGVIVHGSTQQASQLLKNFKDFVFSPAEDVTSTVDFSEVNSFSVFPNPSTSNSTTLLVDATIDQNYQVTVTDALGRQLQYFPSVRSNDPVELELTASGVYFVQLFKEGQIVKAQKLVVQR